MKKEEYNRKGYPQYSVFRSPGEEGKLHARLANGKTMSEEALYEEMAARSKYSSSDIKGMLEAFRTVLALRLSYGEAIELKGLGTFGVSLKAEQVATEKELVPKKVHFGRVTFKASATLTKELKNMKFVRSEGSRLRQYSPERRRQNLLNYLQVRKAFNTSDYQAFNGCSKYMALKDIKSYLAEGLIEYVGVRSHPLYQLTTKE